MGEEKRFKPNPSILSLSEYKVPIPEDIQEQLRIQYRHFNESSTSKDVATIPSSIEGYDEENQSKGDGSDYFTENILYAMKTSPKVTICRVNLILAKSVDQVLDEINEYLDHLFVESKRVYSNCKIAKGNAQDSDIVTNAVKFQAKKHDIFYDVIEIHALASHPDDHSKSAVTSLSSYSSIPSAICSRTSIFSHWPARQNSGFPLHYKVVICDRFCGEAVLRGSDIFVRGILAADRNINCNDEVCVYGHVSSESIPRGMTVEKYNGQCVFLGLGIAKCSRAHMFNQSSGLGVTMYNCVISSISNKEKDNANCKQIFSTKAGPLLPSMNGILSNKIMLQNLPSILVAHVLNPQPKDVIIDMCCAPGGKTHHVASLVDNDATIVACDKSRKKMRSAKKFFEGMGATCIIPIVMDSTKCILDDNEKKKQCWMSAKDLMAKVHTESDGLMDLKGFYPESFDKIILDPPCSALGLVRMMGRDYVLHQSIFLFF